MKNLQLWFGSPLGLPITNKFKMSDDWLSALVAGSAATTNAIIGGVSSLAGANSAVADSNSARHYDFEKFKIARAFQLADRDFALKNQREQMDWQVQQRLAEQAFIAAQNNPRNQVAKLLAAGINPAAVFGQAGSGGQIGSAPSTPSAPGLPSLPQQVGTSAAGLTFSRSEAIASLGDTIAKLTSAAATAGSNFPEVQKAIAEAGKAIAETGTEKEQANWIKTQTLIANAKLPHEIQKLIDDAYEAHSKGDYNVSASMLNNSLEKLNNLEYDIKKETRDTVIATVRAQLVTEQERAKTERAKQNEANASARLSNATALTEEEKREFAVSSAKALATIDNINADIKKGTDVSAAINAANSLLDKQYFTNSAELEEARRRLTYIRSVMDNRNDDAVFRLLDNFLQFVSHNINSALVGAFK